MTAQRVDRAKNDRMSDHELFLSDASLFVDDAEAYKKYQREEPEIAEENVKANTTAAGPSNSCCAVCGSKEVHADDDDDLDIDELNELKASLSRMSIQIGEPGITNLERQIEQCWQSAVYE